MTSNPLPNAVSDLFFNTSALQPTLTERIVNDALDGMDDGELFLEYCQSENLTFDDGVLKNASADISHGFGLRSVKGEATGYAYASELSESALKRAATSIQAVRSGHNGVEDLIGAPPAPKTPLYTSLNPLTAMPFQQKLDVVTAIDTYIRSKEPAVKQVSVSLAGEWQVVMIQRAGGQMAQDIRPLVRLNISVVVEKNGKMERGSFGAGGRKAYGDYITESFWRNAADEALRQALANLESIAIKAGEMPVVLGPGWPGVLLHEAVGHGLEGDFNRKGTSAFAGLLGKQVASKGVTVVDDGTMMDRRGSLTIDDEGTPTQRTVLIEDGILKGYIQDRLNARLMGVSPTGNGRRESYECQPMPRMTNTYMLGGNATQEELISQVKHGLFAVNFSGGQVDITSGKFVFSASEAYLIENGKITQPVKGATLIGNGPDCLTKVLGIGNDMKLDDGIGTCGKDGQSVPVGVGQPSLLLSKMTVGGTEV